MNPQIQVNEFGTPNGLTERYYALTSVWEESFEEEASKLLDRYDRLTPTPDSHIIIRLRVSDIVNQLPFLKELLGDRDAFISIVGQTPAGGSRIALDAWQTEGYTEKILFNRNNKKALYVSLENYAFLLSGSEELESYGGYDQTLEEFENLHELVRGLGGTLKNNLQKTWVFVRDIDNVYDEYAQAKRPFFDAMELNHMSHYITSAGMEAQAESPSRLVKLESYSLFGHKQQQVQYMQALDDMYPTKFFGMTYERGTRIIFGDRSIYYIGGTVSVDQAGNIMHEGDIVGQTQRCIHNLNAILSNHDGSIDDVKVAMFYLRDLADSNIVQKVIADSPLSRIPYLILKAPVADPAWLVGVDATAVNRKGNPKFPCFR